ncbi:type I-E CRISPR-associated protein Cse2/CasB [Rhodomicrobium udaipurense]|uniref:Type I-E CRISPR-associated protein Cse2/CasB n=3 Tax=Rhodomicrobium udaipurense TaxID=1202716 RepID=A0A8I1GC95_9HYPH|nr:type I-E CRISPR-associated protein Cse2/CasB [Rhodomicrobium udaipurense]MBJ7544428.1 type I-E CRISPR-associated protein Cse2/CasB [Rhodomicrobium udaipurense]
MSEASADTAGAQIGTAAPKSGAAKKNEIGEEARKWWQSLQPAKNGEAVNASGGGNRAALAKLRRCSTWIEAAAERETALLFRRVGSGNEQRLCRAAVLAAVLAHVRENETTKIASSVGPQKGDEATAQLSQLRLRRLLSASGDDEILTAFRRLVALKGGKANVANLADLILNWHSEKTRMRFAFDYWQAGDAAPRENPEDGVSTETAAA